MVQQDPVMNKINITRRIWSHNKNTQRRTTKTNTGDEYDEKKNRRPRKT